MTQALEWLIRLALAATTLALVGLLVPALRSRLPAATFPLITRTAAALAGAAWLALALQFLLGNVHIQHVWIYTSRDLAWWYRLAGAWAGREGSLLLWAAILTAVTATVTRKGAPAADATRRHFYAWLLVWQAAFLVLVIQQGTFTPTPAHLVQARPEGNGLNPTLQTPFMLIHPPIQFIAYALATVPAAGALAAMTRRIGARDSDDAGSRAVQTAWIDLVTPASRLGFVSATAGLVLGGVWAYYTLGFGGYWAWDPVEVANLLPWIAWVLWLHTALARRRSGDLPAMAPMLATLPLSLTLLSTLATRSGLWVSVHAFTDPTNAFDPDPASRFLGILAAAPELAGYLALALGSLFVPLTLWARSAGTGAGVRIVGGALAALTALALLAPTKLVSWWFEAASWVPGPPGLGVLLVPAAALALAGLTHLGAEETAKPLGRRDLLKDRGLLVVAASLLGLGLLVIGILFFQSINGWDRAAYDARTPLLLVPLLLGIMVMQGRALLGRRRILLVVGMAIVLAIGASLAFPAQRGGAALIVVALIAIIVGVARLAHTLPGPRNRRGPYAMAIIAGWLDLAWWLSPPSWLPGWPSQLILGAAAAWAIWQLHRAATDPSIDGRVALVVAAGLGGFLIAPLLAGIAAWQLHKAGHLAGTKQRGPPPAKAIRATPMRPAAIQGLHVALVILVAGYAASTWWVDDERGIVDHETTLEVGGLAMSLGGQTSHGEPGTPWVASLHVLVESSGGHTAAPEVYWEPRSASHYPLPATHRSWWRDLYFDVDAICITDAGRPPPPRSGNESSEDATADPCAAEDAWVATYQPAARMVDPQVEAVRLHALSLPGIGLVWVGAALLTLYAAMLTQPATKLKGRERKGSRWQ